MGQGMSKSWARTLVATQFAVVAALGGGSALAADATARPASPGISVLDHQGRVLKTIDDEQERARRAATQNVDSEQQRAAAKADEEQRRKDRVLLASYTTESEIDLARTRATSSIEAQMEGTRLYIAALVRRRAEFEKARTASGKPLPASDEAELARLKKEMEVQDASQLQRKQDLERVNARYAADKLRWQEINGNAAISGTTSRVAAPGGSATK
jgi:hypothetical protein